MLRQRLKILQPSTRAFIREARRTSGYRLFDFLHGYVYARWPYLYIGIGKGEHSLSPTVAKLAVFFNRLLLPILNQNGAKGNSPNESFADTYHGKVVPLQAATELVTIREEIKLENLEKIIPYSKARDIVLKNPEHILPLNAHVVPLRITPVNLWMCV